MPSVIHYTSCPVCGSTDIGYALRAKDYTVTGEQFEIWQCKSCQVRFTQDVPSQASIGRYYQSTDYISHSDTSDGLINQLYKTVRQFTLKQKRKLVGSVTSKFKGKLLDVGAGTGAFLHEMKSHGWEVTGIEPDKSARNVAAEKYNVTLLDENKLFDLPALSFDAITLWHVLEHVHDLHDYMKQLKQLLKQGGKIIIAVPNYTSKDANIYVEHWAAYDVPRHLYHFTPISIQHLASMHQMKVEKELPMWFDSYYVSMLSSKYRKDPAGIVRAGWNGSISNARALMDKRRASSVIYVLGRER